MSDICGYGNKSLHEGPDFNTWQVVRTPLEVVLNAAESLGKCQHTPRK